jgi:hypothetical protein
MADDALAFYKQELDRLGVDDPSIILPKVEARIKRVHKDYFEPKNPNRETAPAGETTAKKVSPPKTDALSIDDLDADEKLHFDQFKNMGLSEEKLLASIANLRMQRGI